jgi:YHS domain-containing protein
MKKLLLFAVVFASIFASAAGKRLVNVDDNGTAIQGYDPVGFFTAHNPVKGDPKFFSVYNGARYYFASAENKKTFDASPAKYEPQFGGYCAYGTSKGKLVPVEIDAFQVVDGRLLMQKNKDIRDSFNEDTKGNLKLADDKWPGLVEKNGK